MPQLETIGVGQGDAPKLTFRFKEKLPDGTKVPYDLAAASVNLIGKDDRDDPDVGAPITYAGTITEDGSTPGAEYSEVEFQVDVSDTATPKVYYAKIVAIKAGLPDTIKKFWLEVENT